MIGQGSPKCIRAACARCVAAAIIVCAWSMVAAAAQGKPVEVRLRIAWGSGGQSPRQWHGTISAVDAELSSIQPLGIEADEAAALRLADGVIHVSPLVDRAFDGCDVTIRGDEAALLKIELRSSATPNAPTASIEVPIAQAAKEPFSASLDAAGAVLLVHRSPGDKMRVSIQRDHLVFAPNEEFSLGVLADLKSEAATNSVSIEARVVRHGSTEALWRTTFPFDPANGEPIPILLNAPTTEGVYRLRLTASHASESLTNRLTPWSAPTVLASRDVEFVVIDPAKRLPRLTPQSTLVETIDPASSSWWQRIPQWTQVDKLPAFATPRPLGNVKPRPVPESAQGFVELPARVGGEPTWQAFVLPIREPGQAYAVEIDLPQGRAQHVTASVIEPDAAGRVTTFGRDGGAYTDDRVGLSDRTGDVDVHRIDFWPRTRSPVLLVANQSGTRAAQFGKIRLLRRSVASPPDAESEPQPQRLAAAYISAPKFAEAFGAAEELDPVSGLSVDGWTTFLLGGNRLAQQLRAAGYNAAILGIAADGGSLAPIGALGAAPRYDTGMLSGGGVDPLRKDVLEALLRIFDREGLRLIPAVQLTTPLAGVEVRRTGDDPRVDGFQWIGADGRTMIEHRSATAEAPHYNLLNVEVQAGISEVVAQLTSRYGKHPSLAGVALQLSSNGFGVLPGLAWGFDDATAARFSAETTIALPLAGDDRFAQRAATALGPHRDQWRQWRVSQATAFYERLAAQMRRARPELELVLCTEDLYAGAEAILAARGPGSERSPRELTLEDMGISARRLGETPGITLLRPRRLGGSDVDAPTGLPASAIAELEYAAKEQTSGGELHLRNASRLRLPSFDVQSPFGADRTHLSLVAPSVPAGAASRRALTAALANRDFAMLVDGSETAAPAWNASYSEALRTFQSLPATAEIRTERRQPVTLRVYREAKATTACLINESPWPVTVQLPLSADAATPWRRLGADPAASSDSAGPASGTLAAGSQTWKVELPAFSVVARRFGDRGLKVGTLAAAVSEQASAALAARVAEIERRMRGLDIEREYQVLDNPGFELAADAKRGWGWEPRVGEAGSVEVDSTTARTGGKSLHLRSETAPGVAAQSQLIPIPATGRLTIRAHVRTRGMAPDAQLYAWMEYDVAGKPRQRYRALGNGQTLGEQWTPCEFALDDLPTEGAATMRIHFHLVGQGEAWIDDVRLYDLQFPEAQRVELFKRLYAANAALDEGQLVDCQRLVDGDWARYLIEHVPATSVASAAAAEAPPAPSADGEKGFGGRIRGIVPRVWR